MFAFLRPSLATAYSYALGWCFLPNASFEIPGLPDYTKSFATMIGVLLGLSLFSPSSFLRFRPSFLDLPVAVFCTVPFVSSMTNGLGEYDGLSAILHNIIVYGFPYLIGRCTFSGHEEIRDLIQAVLVCGLLYVPLCLWEVRMSPQLHTKLYGFHQHIFSQTRRMGGWRPVVFMQHGLQVALWMCGSLLLYYARWQSRDGKSILKIPVTWAFFAMLVTFLLLKSAGAYFLAILGFAILFWVHRLRKPWPLMLIPALVVFYIVGRSTEYYTGRGIARIARDYLGEAREGSITTRLDNEDRLIAKAKQQWLFGWGGWGRNRIANEVGKDITITDGLWIIIFGINGVVGLASCYTMLLAGPCAVALLSSNHWRSLSPIDGAHLAGLSTICSLSAVDSLPNAVVLPIFTVSLGGLVAIATSSQSFAKIYDYDFGTPVDSRIRSNVAD